MTPRLPPMASASGGILFVLSAPSGTGKTTLSRRLIERVPRLRPSISATTRAPRPGEREGVDYHFVTSETFERMVREQAFLEWAAVHGNRYGTPRSEWIRAREAGIDLVLDIDTQGAFRIRERVPDSVLVFVLPPSIEALEGRIRGRAQDDEATIRRRLDGAAGELSQAGRYDYVIVNDELERATSALAAIVTAERARARRVLATDRAPVPA